MQFQCDCHAEKMVAVSRAGTDDASRHDQGVEVGSSLELSTEGCLSHFGKGGCSS